MVCGALWRASTSSSFGDSFGHGGGDPAQSAGALWVAGTHPDRGGWRGMGHGDVPDGAGTGDGEGRRDGFDPAVGRAVAADVGRTDCFGPRVWVDGAAIRASGRGDGGAGD